MQATSGDNAALSVACTELFPTTSRKEGWMVVGLHHFDTLYLLIVDKNSHMVIFFLFSKTVSRGLHISPGAGLLAVEYLHQKQYAARRSCPKE